jgi:hypothetical protein
MRAFTRSKATTVWQDRVQTYKVVRTSIKKLLAPLIKGIQHNFLNMPQNILFKSISYADQCGTAVF